MDERERNDLQSTISQALQIIKEKAGDKFDIEKVKLLFTPNGRRAHDFGCFR